MPLRLRRRGFLHLAAGALALPALPRLSVADSYPSRRITMVVPFAPGALSDIIARVMAEGMQALLGQTVVIENAGGADGTIGSGRVAHAVPDGYTLVCANWNTSVTNPAIYKLDYDVVTDFEPVVLLPAAPMVLLTKKDNPATNLKEFIAYLKANQLEASERLTFFGAVAPLRRLRKLLPTVRAWSAPSAGQCLAGYLETGWFGRVPRTCDDGIIIIPIDQANLIWGWPDRFLARMREHHADVMLVGRIDSLAKGQWSRLDTIQELSRVPSGFDGSIWTDQIRVIGPAVRKLENDTAATPVKQ